jgi:flagellar P-ring protein precursor FlgI
MKRLILIAQLFVLVWAQPAWADRIKDLTSVATVRANQLLGYGLVIGLQGSGDGADVPFAGQSLRSMLNQLGVSIDGTLSDFDAGVSTKATLDVKNVAAVMVTAELPAFAKPGQTIDVNVSTIGKSTSLRGGQLIMTRLRGVDGSVYAIAQGALTMGAVEASAAGSSVSTGVTTSGRIPSGALVERAVETAFDKADTVVLNTRTHDFTTTNAIVNAINEKFGAGVAKSLDGVSLALTVPQEISQRVAFMSMIENIDVVPGEETARVVVNSRTGTVVINRNVRVTAAAVTHGGITVKISGTNEVSQANPFAPPTPQGGAGGQTAALTNADVTVSEAKNPMFLFKPGVDLRDIVDAINQIGATPSAMIAILEALKRAGSLRADLLVI